MNREVILAELEEEINRLIRVRDLIDQSGIVEVESTPSVPAKKPATSAKTDGRRLERSPESRARMALAQQKRRKVQRAAAKRAPALR